MSLDMILTTTYQTCNLTLITALLSTIDLLHVAGYKSADFDDATFRT